MSELTVDKFSQHLFWDAKKSEIDFEKNKSYVIWQVLEYGLMKDWKLIQKH